MDLHHYFPSVIGKEDHPEWVPSMKSEVEKIFKGPKQNVNKNFYYNGETTYGTQSLTDAPEFEPFVNFVKGRAKEFLDLQGYDTARLPWRPYFFANSFNKGSTHPKHVHSQCSISGIFYISTPPGSSKITFYPNQPFKDFFDYMYLVKDTDNWYSMQSVSYQPYPGLMLMWPAWLYHEVLPNDSNEPRTSIVFNL